MSVIFAKSIKAPAKLPSLSFNAVVLCSSMNRKAARAPARPASDGRAEVAASCFLAIERPFSAYL
jgi:hypothetical protein